jgi:thioredoxin 2
VLADFNASWCPPCAAMKHDTWTDDGVERAVTRGTIPLLVDIDQQPTVAARYDVNAIPTVLLLDASGQVIRRAGFLPASGVLRFLADD